MVKCSTMFPTDGHFGILLEKNWQGFLYKLYRSPKGIPNAGNAFNSIFKNPEKMAGVKFPCAMRSVSIMAGRKAVQYYTGITSWKRKGQGFLYKYKLNRSLKNSPKVKNYHNLKQNYIISFLPVMINWAYAS